MAHLWERDRADRENLKGAKSRDKAGGSVKGRRQVGLRPKG